jgi:hypothetical protein
MDHPPWPARAWQVERLAALGLFALGIWLYSNALKHDRMPPGHPWTGGMLVVAALLAFTSPRRWQDAGTGHRVAAVAGLVAFVVCGVSWYWTAWNAPPVYLGL